MNTWKILQRKTYDVLSHKYFLIGVFPSCLLSVLLLSVIEIGEVWMIWSEKGSNGRGVDIIGGSRGCEIAMEIDAVYTWVNGSDPVMLHNLKHLYQDVNYIESWTDCPHSDCMPSHVVFYRSCEMFSRALQNLLPVPHTFQETNIFVNQSNFYDCLNVSTILIYFESLTDASQALHIKNMSGSLFHGFWTTDTTLAGSFPCPEWILLSGYLSKFPSQSPETIKSTLSRKLRVSILEVWPYPEMDSIILKLPTAKAVDTLIARQGELSFSADMVFLYKLNLALYNPYYKRQDQFAPSRFEDKEELRYSLRSLERHAPWIRHVYLVTNGQIPYWLNLDHPQISLVTHDDIFLNKSHLPTFSSPAIESHLHRIKGLSEKFLYLNDDIMFAQDVWPEDFFTNSRGYKVYLSWPVPDCSPSCVWSWVSDGTCDSECNVEECGFDGGDCNETDSGPSRAHAQAFREDFSFYEDMASKEFPPDMDTAALEKLMMDAGPEYLHSPNLIHSNVQNPPMKDFPYIVGTRTGGTYHNNSDLFHHREVEDDGRKRRSAVKKNLASHLYVGSSMVAGQSADFLGSVTDSKTSIKEALHVASQLREGKISMTVGSIKNVSKAPERGKYILQTKNIGKNFSINSNYKVDGNYNALDENSLLNRNFKTGPKPRHDSGGLQHPEKVNILDAVTLQNALEQERRENSSLQLHPSLLGSNKESVKHERNLRNLTLLRRQHLLNMMENDLNESAGHAISKKGFKNRGKTQVRTLDTFAESLLHVNMLYNRVYGFEARRVPAHAPHFINKEIMYKLQKKFSKEWEETSSHRLRDPHDMQFAFSYYYFLMSEEEDVHMEELFKIYDTDHSGTWSDREIRTLLTRLYPAPLNPHHLIQFEEIVLKCYHKESPSELSSSIISTPLYERYQDSPLPTVTWTLVRDCGELRKLLLSHLGRKMKYKFEVVREWSRDITFKMLSSNVSHLVGYLDEIRRNPKKFVCLNDNLDPKQEDENAMVRAVLRDFYHSFFPSPSKFELPPDMRNRFLHVSELNEWKNNRSKLRTAVVFAVITLCLLTLAVVCPDEFRHHGRRIFEISCARRRRISRLRSTYSSV